MILGYARGMMLGPVLTALAIFAFEFLVNGLLFTDELPFRKNIGFKVAVGVGVLSIAAAIGSQPILYSDD